MGLEDPLSLILREAALELTAAVDAIEGHGAKLGHVRAVQSGAPDVLGSFQELRQQADRIQNLESAWLNRRGARLPVRFHFPLDDPYAHSVASELAGSEQSRGTGADNQNIVSQLSSFSMVWSVYGLKSSIVPNYST
jgi:hypothetical protein